MSATARRRPMRRVDIPQWAVSLAVHTMSGGRYRVPAQTVVVSASTPAGAIRRAVQRAHINAEVPPFRSMLAESVAHATARPHVDPER